MPLRGALCPGGDGAFQESCGLLIRKQELNNLEVQKMRYETEGKEE